MSERLAVIRQVYSWWDGDDNCGSVEIEPRIARSVHPSWEGHKLPGEELLSDAQYMSERSAEFVRQWVADWRAMPRDEFLDLCERL